MNDIRHKATWSIILLCWLIFVIAAVVFSLDFSRPREQITFGATFSHKYARWPLGLEWREAYEAMLEEFDFKEVRLMTYWDMVEERRGQYDFHEIDFMMDRAQEYGVNVTLVVGQRQPRWPECHLPSWAQYLSADEQQDALLAVVSATVERYRHHPALAQWQVENEPLLEFFGECEPLDLEFFKKEIALVHTLDPDHPVMTTASGEFDSWSDTATFTDTVGVSLYKVIAKKGIGNIRYPLPAAFYRWRADYNKKTDSLFISELQGEPWTVRSITEVSKEEFYEQMNARVLREHVDFAVATGFDRIWIWGIEWWYWLKTQHNNPTLWEAARELFNEPTPTDHRLQV